jgi:hypothetical protein
MAGEALQRYLAMAERELADHVVVRLRPEHWTGTDLGAV